MKTLPVSRPLGQSQTSIPPWGDHQPRPIRLLNNIAIFIDDNADVDLHITRSFVIRGRIDRVRKFYCLAVYDAFMPRIQHKIRKLSSDLVTPSVLAMRACASLILFVIELSAAR